MSNLTAIVVGRDLIAIAEALTAAGWRCIRAADPDEAREHTGQAALVVMKAPTLASMLETATAPALPRCDLSRRLRQTLDALITTGDSEKQIADRLGISPHTAHQYVKTLFRRFGVNSRAELMAKAAAR